eukprot:2021671-Pyramimonas_sp.AAC.1
MSPTRPTLARPSARCVTSERASVCARGLLRVCFRCRQGVLARQNPRHTASRWHYQATDSLIVGWKRRISTPKPLRDIRNPCAPCAPLLTPLWTELTPGNPGCSQRW